MRRPQRGDRGFTLIEMLVVMILIGLMTAVMIPMFVNNRQSARESQARAVLGVYYPQATVSDLELISSASGKRRMSGLVDFGQISSDCIFVLHRDKTFTLRPGDTMKCEGTVPAPAVPAPAEVPTSSPTTSSTPDSSATAEPVPTVTVTQTVTAPAP